jgi:DNA-binding transcriptional ArsR family regulator
MVDNQGVLDATFGALSDRTRRAMLARLATGTATVTDLAEPFEMSLQAVSKHLQVLERAGLVRRTREGRVHHCRIEAARLQEAVAWMERYRSFWENRLDALAEFVAEEP